ncbi:copper resistance CopC family protein [Galbitalea soli]|uniref:Copper resistance protein CopC n=1 Tax=Galbitalea soli TaxID=1268042 RepID=A0A7C9TRI3_9MICO|nr:copper resistance CopC family protein [Galbitalea soli]NEM91699.1 copper resistance protein CopC [Galbitalea soli]NYJ30395.1 hypothetical protein [Galbitalea soli]
MTTRRNPVRGILTAAATLALVAGSVLGLAESASAHNYLISSTPAAGSTLTTLPASFELTTNEPLLDLTGHGAGFAFQVKDAHGSYYGDGCLTVRGPTLSTEAALGAPGAYTVVWQIISADGHTVSGSIPFTWAPTGTVAPAAGHATPQNCGGRSGGQVPVTQQLPSGGSAAPTANLGIVLGVGGGVLGLGLVVTVILLVAGRRRTP